MASMSLVFTFRCCFYTTHGYDHGLKVLDPDVVQTVISINHIGKTFTITTNEFRRIIIDIVMHSHESNSRITQIGSNAFSLHSFNQLCFHGLLRFIPSTHFGTRFFQDAKDVNWLEVAIEVCIDKSTWQDYTTLTIWHIELNFIVINEVCKE
jgi:hypothetical protein